MNLSTLEGAADAFRELGVLAAGPPPRVAS
jgi:hypothetical protein